MLVKIKWFYKYFSLLVIESLLRSKTYLETKSLTGWPNKLKTKKSMKILQSFLISTLYSSHYVRLEKLIMSTVYLACFFDLRFIAISNFFNKRTLLLVSSSFFFPILQAFCWQPNFTATRCSLKASSTNKQQTNLKYFYKVFI